MDLPGDSDLPAKCQKLLGLFDTAVDSDSQLDVLLAGRALLRKHRASLGLDLQKVQLNTIKAAASLGQDGLARQIWQDIDAEFPENPKVDRLALSTLVLDSTKTAANDARLRVAKAAIGKDTTDMADRRGLLAVMKLQSDNSAEYCAILEEHLEDIPTDTGVWRELGSLHLRSGRYVEARAVFEELSFCLDPSNIFYLLTLADICFSTRSLVAAIKYFALAVVYEPYNARGLWGIVNTFAQLTSDMAQYTTLLQEYKEVALMSAERLCKMYELELAKKTQSTEGASKREEAEEMVNHADAERSSLLFLEAQCELCRDLISDISNIDV